MTLLEDTLPTVQPADDVPGPAQGCWTWNDLVALPDVVVLKEHQDRMVASRIVGAPDLVVEILSPSTAGYDRRQQQDAYERAGVPEYWIADRASRTVEVLALELGKYRSLGVFRGQATLPSRVLPDFTVPVEKRFPL